MAEALNEHFTQQRPFSTGVKGFNFYVRNTVLRCDCGSEFINVSILDVCSLAMAASLNTLAQGNWANTKME